MKLTIGMPTYKDFDGVYFTLQALTLYHRPPCELEILVIDTHPRGCKDTRIATERCGGRYIHAPDCNGPAAGKDRVFREARGDVVCCIDCHILFVPHALSHLVTYFEKNPDTKDLVQGPLLYDEHKSTSTHFNPKNWSGGMWGTWENDPRSEGSEPFEIPMQGAGLLCMRKDAWPGFNPLFRGFGGEEGYIHEKVRQQGGKCVCIPQLKWVHRFGRPDGIPYRLALVDRVVNYLVGFRELGLDETPVHDHFLAFNANEYKLGLAEANRICPRNDGKPIGPTPNKLLITAQSWVADVQLPRERTPAFLPVEPQPPATPSRPVQPLISCLCPTFGRGGTPFQILVEEAIASFLQQTDLDSELLVLNDHPQQEYLFEHPRVCVVNTRRRFRTLGEKYNALVGLARGELFCPWEDDDISLPWRLALSRQLLGSGPYLNPRKYWFLDGEGLHHTHPMGVGHNLSMFTREAFERVKGYPIVSTGQDCFVDTQLANMTGSRCGGPDKVEILSVDQWWYIYRWGVSNVHLSSRHPRCDEFYEEVGGMEVPTGKFELKPRWQKDYVKLIQEYLVSTVAAALAKNKEAA